MLRVFNKIIGLVPYGFSVEPRLVLKKQNHYGITIDSPRVRLQVVSLDRVWQTTFRRGWTWKDLRAPLSSKPDTQFNICWTTTRGWWVQGRQTGRRTRPMPKVMGALLCGALISTFPRMLDITFSHADNIENPSMAYGLLAGATLLMCALIGWYLWLGSKAKPSGFLEAVSEFVRRIGSNDTDRKDVPANESGDSTKTSP